MPQDIDNNIKNNNIEIIIPEEMDKFLKKLLTNAGLSSENIASLGTQLGSSEFVQALIGNYKESDTTTGTGTDPVRQGQAVDPGVKKFDDSVGVFTKTIEDLSTLINKWLLKAMDLFGSTDGKNINDTLNTLDITNQRVIGMIDKSMQDGTKTRLLNVADRHTSTS